VDGRHARARLFDERRGEVTKLVAKNHQLLGVNNAIAAVEHIKDNHGKLGVFWHTQGSGKSYSMVFFSQKVLRKIPGNWTFVIVTDREDLDGQIYRNFANTGALLEDEKRVRADSGESLKRMLNQEDHRYVFTLIQKFHTEHGERYPVLSTRSDIIVVTDEAHRSQYDIFASNMRSALAVDGKVIMLAAVEWARSPRFSRAALSQIRNAGGVVRRDFRSRESDRGLPHSASPRCLPAASRSRFQPRSDIAEPITHRVTDLEKCRALPE